MPNYRDMAIAAHVDKTAEEEADEQAERDEFRAAGIEALRPLFLDNAGEPLVPDFTVYLAVKHLNMLEDDVLVALTDGSGVHFGVHPREGTVQLYRYREATDRWEAGTHVTSLAEVGHYLQEGDW
jgi:hypothetical protein